MEEQTLGLKARVSIWGKLFRTKTEYISTWKVWNITIYHSLYRILLKSNLKTISIANFVLCNNMIYYKMRIIQLHYHNKKEIKSIILVIVWKWCNQCHKRNFVFFHLNSSKSWNSKKGWKISIIFLTSFRITNVFLLIVS